MLGEYGGDATGRKVASVDPVADVADAVFVHICLVSVRGVWTVVLVIEDIVAVLVCHATSRNLRVDASDLWDAPVGCALLAVIAVEGCSWRAKAVGAGLCAVADIRVAALLTLVGRRIGTSGCRVARIRSADVVVVAFWRRPALALACLTGVACCASVLIVAGCTIWQVEQDASDCGYAPVGCAVVVVVAQHRCAWLTDAVETCIAGCAQITVVARSRVGLMSALAILAGVVGARVVVAALHVPDTLKWFMNATNSRVAPVASVGTVIGAINLAVRALAGNWVAGVVSAQIVVSAVDRRSGINHTEHLHADQRPVAQVAVLQLLAVRGGLAFAGDELADAHFVLARVVFGAWVAVVARFCVGDVHALSGRWIARVIGACVAIIAKHRLFYLADRAGVRCVTAVLIAVAVVAVVTLAIVMTTAGVCVVDALASV